MLRDLYYQEDNLQEEANCRVFESYEEEVSDRKFLPSKFIK